MLVAREGHSLAPVPRLAPVPLCTSAQSWQMQCADNMMRQESAAANGRTVWCWERCCPARSDLQPPLFRPLMAGCGRVADRLAAARCARRALEGGPARGVRLGTGEPEGKLFVLCTCSHFTGFAPVQHHVHDGRHGERAVEEVLACAAVEP